VRTILLWMAGNRWLKRRLPKLWFARRAVRRFMPGETMDAALEAGAMFGRDGIATLYTELGENVTTREEATAVVDGYIALMDRIRAAGIDGEASVKLTHLGLDLDPALAATHTERLAAKAAENGKRFWIDMEGSDYTERTIAMYEQLKPRHPNLGLCMQSYLRRTATDVQRLLPVDPAVRLVKGAYNEPGHIAYRSRAEVDTNFVAVAVTLLTAKREGRGVFVGLGTHDVRLVEQIAAHASAVGLDRKSFEVQMLYGIRVDQQRRLAREGYAVRDLISYGDAWYPWYMRRLAERPANVLFVLRQLVG
jgi:proline dehydrogenase